MDILFINMVLLHYKCKLHSNMLVFSEHSITNHKISIYRMLLVCFDWSFRRIKKIGEDLTLLP